MVRRGLIDNLAAISLPYSPQTRSTLAILSVGSRRLRLPSPATTRFDRPSCPDDRPFRQPPISRPTTTHLLLPPSPRLPHDHLSPHHLPPPYPNHLSPGPRLLPHRPQLLHESAMTAPTPPQAPKLPSRKIGAILATAMLAVGIALGALIGPGPEDSLASSSRAATIGRVLALLALGSGTSSGGDLALSSGAANPPASTPQPTPPSSSEATAGSDAGAAVPRAPPRARPTPRPHPLRAQVSPTSSTTPAAGEEKKKAKRNPKPSRSPRSPTRG